MRKLVSIIAILTSVVLSNCSPNQNIKTLQFVPLSGEDFNYPADTSFVPPKDKRWNERKKMHDSCMGASFPANAIFIRTKDTFRLGCIVNRKTMKIVKDLDPRDYTRDEVSTMLNFMTKPCYERMPFSILIDSFFRTRIIINLPGANENLNNEFNTALHTSVNTHVEIGSWVNLEMTNALGKILDTTKDATKLEYKKYLLQTDNMVLIRSAAITDITFYVDTKKSISNKLHNILIPKPVATVENSNLKPQIFFVNNNSIEITFTGIFQAMGQFMRCELR